MKKNVHLQGLERLSFLRERQVELLNADMASRRAVQNRYRGNIERLEQLCRSAGLSATTSTDLRSLSPALSLNCGGYKQGIMKMADAHRVDLSLHEADMELARRSLAAAARNHEALDQLLARARADERRSEDRRERKLEDETAVRAWNRGRR